MLLQLLRFGNTGNIFGVPLQSRSEYFSKTRHHNSSSVIIFLQELLTRHKSTVAEFLIKNEDWVSSLTMYQIIKFCLRENVHVSSLTVQNQSGMTLSCFDLQFFSDYNSKLLESTNYITRRQAIKVG